MSMNGPNPIKDVINRIPVPCEKLNTIIQLEGISKIFHKKDHSVSALKNIHCKIYQGEMVAIMGTSGSGKSTLLNMISAIDEPTEGKIFLFGEEAKNHYKEPYSSNFRKENVGFVFQSFQLLKDLSVEDNIALPLILNNVPQQEIQKRIRRTMEKLEIYQWRKHRPHELSGGQQQRVAIARAIINNPPLLLADEPTGALDFNTSKDILQLLVNIQREFNQTTIIVTHDPNVATYADRVLFFHDGLIVDHYQNTHSSSDFESIMSKFKVISKGGM